MKKHQYELAPCLLIWVFPKIGVKPPKWMVKIMENPIKMGWFGGKTHYFRKHPYWDHRFSTKSSGFFHRFNKQFTTTVSWNNKFDNRFNLQNWKRWVPKNPGRCSIIAKNQKKSTGDLFPLSKFILPKNEKKNSLHIQTAKLLDLIGTILVGRSYWKCSNALPWYQWHKLLGWLIGAFRSGKISMFVTSYQFTWYRIYCQLGSRFFLFAFSLTNPVKSSSLCVHPRNLTNGYAKWWFVKAIFFQIIAILGIHGLISSRFNGSAWCMGPSWVTPSRFIGHHP